MTRQEVIDILGSVFRFGEIRSSKLDSGNSVQVGIETSSDASGPSDDELWSHGPLNFRPTVGDECFFMQLGDEKIVLATKSRSHEVTVANGEVSIRAMGAASGASVLLKPNGDIYLGGSATQLVALENLVLANLNELKTAINAATPTPNDGGAALKLALMTSLNTPSGTGGPGGTPTQWPHPVAAEHVRAL